MTCVMIFSSLWSPSKENFHCGISIGCGGPSSGGSGGRDDGLSCTHRLLALPLLYILNFSQFILNIYPSHMHVVTN